MNLKKLTGQAKQLFEQRGGMEAVKEDARELKDIATSKRSSLGDKAKAAVEAIKDPGAKDEAPPEQPGETPA